jgi:di/tricarboxylate transporter
MHVDRRIVIVGIFPDFGAVGGAAQLRDVVGALLMFVLITATLMLIVCGVTCAIAASNGHFQSASRARIGLWVSCGAAVLAGAGVALVNFLLNIGTSL